ncbi:MAG: class I SAM-dependent methyltransferase [Bryobacteraceae bacterium]|nr:class I SAM-dependent methyltransferase [Bryobacteraceae bacterium]
MSQDLQAKRAVNPVKEGLERTGLYHSMRLPDGSVLEGAMPLSYQEDRWRWFQLPEDLTGLTALDVGPWDGYFTFELERRGAQVTAIDYADLDTFRRLHHLMGSRAKYLKMDLYDVTRESPGEFDIVLLLGVLYHLKHPLLALERVCAITKDTCIIDTFVADPEAYARGERPAIPYAEFYETGELGGQLDNWCGPTVTQVSAWARAAGFVQPVVLKVTSTTACIRASRRWRDLPPATLPAIQLHGVNAASHGGGTFESRKEEYLVYWCDWPSEPALDDVFPEVDGFGVPPMAVRRSAQSLAVTTRVPPGLAPGRHEARLRVGAGDWSNVVAFHMDVPPLAGELKLTAVQDAVTFGEADWANGGWLALWVEGLSEVADIGNVSVEVDGVPHGPRAISGAQVNVQLRPLFEAGPHELVVTHRGARSNPFTFYLKGNRPPIHGVDSIQALS